MQFNNNQFAIQPDMLPDLGNKLQKCAIIVQSFIENFDENNEDEKYHSLILDKQDSNIANYFINLFDSVVVADDDESSKIAVKTIINEGEKIVKPNNRDNFERSLNTIIARRSLTDVNSIITELTDYFDKDLLKANNMEFEDITEKIFEKMKMQNPSVTYDFRTNPFEPKKVRIRNENRSILISLEKSLVDMGVIKILNPDENSNMNTSMERSYIIEINEEVIDDVQNL